MPQEHYVLRCFSCETFQAHIVKKSKKWECKICGTKQSLKRNYGKGSGKECRVQVMKLNELRLTQEEIVGEDMDKDETDIKNNYCESSETHYSNSEIENEECSNFKNLDDNKPFKSKWDVFLDNDKKSSEEDEDPETFTWGAKSKKRKRSQNEVVTSVKKVPSNYKLENTVKPKSVNNQKLNRTENSEKINTVQNVSKWGMYLNSQEDNIEEESKEGENVFDNQEDDLDEILKL